MTININTTKLPRLDKIIPFCKIISLGSGNAPKYITVELPTHDGARIKVWWTGAPSIAVDDYVRVQRQGADKRYIIVGTDRTTVGAILNNYTATAAPTVNDDSGDGYSIGSVWIDTTNDNVYVATDVTATAANWEQINGGGASQLDAPDGSPAPAWSVDNSGHLQNDGGGSLIIGSGGLLAFDSSLTDEFIYNPSDGNIDIVVEGETGLRVDAGVGVILPLAARDIYVLGDTEIGLGGRFAQGYTIEDHFIGTSLDAAWTWAGAPFATPGEASMTAIASCLQLAFTSGTDPRGFLYRTDSLTTTVRVVGLAFNNPTDLTFCGYRFDDSSDNNYVEVAIRKTSGAGTWQLISRYRTGGGAVTTTVHHTINDIPKFVGCRLQISGTQWSSWNVLAAIGIDSPAVSIAQFVSGLTWTPTRRGICFTSIGSPPGSFQGPYIDWVS